MNMSPENKAHFQAEKEAIHLIFTVIRDEIYSTVDACQTAQEMWKAIKGLQQGKSLNIQDVKTNLFWEFGKFTSHDGETMESYYIRFYKPMNEMIRNNLTVNVQFLQQLQPEWSRFVTQTSKSHKSYAPLSKPSIPTRSHTTTRYKGKEIAKPITPPSETASEEDSDPKQAQRDKDMQKNLALIAKYFKKIYKPTNNNLRTSSNSRNKNVDMTLWENVGSPVVQQSGIHCFNYKEFGHFAKECRKQKRVKDSAYHKEKMLLCKQAEQGVPLQAEQYDWLADTDEEIDEQELEARYSYMAKIQENDQNDVESDDERVALANSKLDVNEKKKIQKQLKKANTTLAQELKECKTILAQTSKTLKELIPDGEETLALKRESQSKLNKDSDIEILIRTCLMPLALKTQNDSFIFVHELKQEMHVDLKYVESLENEIDELESDKAEFSNMYDMILQENVLLSRESEKGAGLPKTDGFGIRLAFGCRTIDGLSNLVFTDFLCLFQ
nr:hypothetical protein [Tanacetum cinerariifolium]